VEKVVGAVVLAHLCPHRCLHRTHNLLLRGHVENLGKTQIQIR
jgi:hypothetical protein